MPSNAVASYGAYHGVLSCFQRVVQTVHQQSAAKRAVKHGVPKVLLVIVGLECGAAAWKPTHGPKVNVLIYDEHGKYPRYL